MTTRTLVEADPSQGHPMTELIHGPKDHFAEALPRIRRQSRFVTTKDGELSVLT